MVTCFSVIIVLFVLIGFIGFLVSEITPSKGMVEVEEVGGEWGDLLCYLMEDEEPVTAAEGWHTLACMGHVSPKGEEDMIDLSCLSWSALEAEVAPLRTSHRKVSVMRTASAVFIMG